MVDAGIARKVDFGEGRSRFEPSYRHPAPLSSHLQRLPSLVGVSELGRRGADRGDRRRRAISRRRRRSCRSSAPARSAGPARKTPPIDGATTELRVRARRAAHRDRHRAQRPRVLHARRDLTKDRARPHGVPEARRRGARAPRHAREALSRAARDRIRSSNRGRRSCSSRARPAACSPKAPSSCARASNDQQALLIGIKCERGSHKFFKRYGERFEDSEGKQIFLEFADEERAHLDLLIREYRALRERQRRAGRARRRAAPAQSAPLIDLHTHTTASDGRCTPAELVARAAAAGVTVLARHRPRHGRRLRRGRRSACAAAGIEFVPGIEITAVRDGVDVHVLGYFIDRAVAGARARFSPSSAGAASIACAQMIERLADARHPSRRRRDPAARRSTMPAKAAGRPWIARALVAARLRDQTSSEAFERWLSRGRPAFVPRLGAAPEEVFDAIHDAGRHRVARASGAASSTTSGLPDSPPPGSTRSRCITPITTRRRRRTTGRWRAASGSRGLRRLRLSRRRVARRRQPGQRVAAARRVRTAEGTVAARLKPALHRSSGR